MRNAKLSDIDIDVLIDALRRERSDWATIASKEGRKHTDAERVTICILSALERVFAKAKPVE